MPLSARHMIILLVKRLQVDVRRRRAVKDRVIISGPSPAMRARLTPCRHAVSARIEACSCLLLRWRFHEQVLIVDVDLSGDLFRVNRIVAHPERHLVVMRDRFKELFVEDGVVKVVFDRPLLGLPKIAWLISFNESHASLSLRHSIGVTLCQFDFLLGGG